MTQVFISYSHHDLPWILGVVDAARAVGVGVYIDNHDPQPGRLLADKLLQAIRTSDAVVVFVSPHSLRSTYVGHEVGCAIDADKQLIALVTPGVPEEELGMLKGREYIPFDPADPEVALASLARELHRLDRSRQLQVDLARQRKFEQTVAGVLLVLIGLALLASIAGDGTV